MNRKTFLKKTAEDLILTTPAYLIVNCSSSEDSETNKNQDNEHNCITNAN